MIKSGNDTVTINNSDVSSIVTLAGFGSKISKEGFKKAFKKYAKQELQEKLTRQLSKKGVVYTSRLLTAAVTAIDVYCAWQWLAKGYTYTKYKYGYEEWKIYKHQGGKWVSGYSYKSWPIKVWGSK